MRTALRQDRYYVTASPALRERILRKLDDESALKGTRSIEARRAKGRPHLENPGFPAADTRAPALLTRTKPPPTQRLT